jgi:hypothetical protein
MLNLRRKVFILLREVAPIPMIQLAFPKPYNTTIVRMLHLRCNVLGNVVFRLVVANMFGDTISAIAFA